MIEGDVVPVTPLKDVLASNEMSAAVHRQWDPSMGTHATGFGFLKACGPAPEAEATVPSRPDEKFEEKMNVMKDQQRKEEETSIIDEHVLEARGNISSKISLWASKAKRKTKTKFIEAQTRIEQSVRTNDIESAKRSFTKDFIGANDDIVSWYPCSILSHGEIHSCTLYIGSSAMYCFSRSKNTKITVPWIQVASVVKAVSVQTTDCKRPFILPLPSPEVRPSCIEIYCEDGNVIQLLRFGSDDAVRTAVAEKLSLSCDGSALDRGYTYIMHCWRSVKGFSS
eukprot:TRINITY_DN16617_c0_g1_i1.p1 TRINITY_DN16617_c0_g1~~TRINITY_DN16617_c0_g1_i1.p1  ORF type:complete len:296 (+),score=42.03 TRINITY_DN16617_c0_g1_i1:45-890(+)